MSINRAIRYGVIMAGTALLISACGDSKNGPTEGGPTLSTANVSTGEVTRVVNASGKIVPQNEVLVGAEVSGRVLEVLVDYNSNVEEGDLLARIDPENFENTVRQLKSRRDSASADLAVQDASIRRAQVSLEQAQQNLQRKQNLFDDNAVSEAQLEQAVSQAGIAEADLALAEARLESAKAQVREVSAQLNTAEANLARTIIRSPIKGVVIDRKIDPGQTVQASFSAPELFSIAADLSEVSVEAQIVESDVAGLGEGDTVKFNVDAYPDDALPGTVEQLRLQSNTNNNIVTYVAVITADNSDGKLLPGMTANLEIITDVKAGVLRIPSAAERFRPSPQQIAMFEAEGAANEEPKSLNDPVYDRLRRIGVTGGQLDGIKAQIEGASAPLLEIINDPERSFMHTPMKVRLKELQENMLKTALDSTELSEYNALVASERSIREAEIWVATGDGKMQKRNVRLGLSDGAFVEVVSGLEEGDALVTGIGAPGGGGGRGPRRG